MRLTTTALLLLCVGCGGIGGCGQAPVSTVRGSAGTLREYRLQDGTRCVTYRDGITCDWQHSRNEVE
jgi:hypothetical protein